MYIGIQGARSPRSASADQRVMFNLKCGMKARAYRQKSDTRWLRAVPGVGIKGMRERIHQLGGSLEIGSDGNGKGTAVVVKLPVANVVTPVAAPNEDDAAAD